MVQSQSPEQQPHHGRMTQDEMEVAIRELLGWMNEVKQTVAEMRVALQRGAITPQTTMAGTGVTAWSDGAPLDLTRSHG